MWIADSWKEYKVLDTSAGEKLEDWCGYKLVRPDPQVIWNTEKKLPEWKRPNAHYHRSSKGGGEWEFFDLPEEWQISYQLGGESELKFGLKPFSFKHTGLFPEQAVNWEWFSSIIKKAISSGHSSNFGAGALGAANVDSSVTSHRPKVLNLFAYTGGATLAAAASGAQVTHVDASKGMVGWAKENATISKIDETRFRWLVDDCVKFVEREIRRGNHYDAIIMDPPSYGRGPKGEIWKIEEAIFPLVEKCCELLSDKPLFFLINSYTTGLQPAVLSYMLGETVSKKFGGKVTADEIGLPVESNGLVLPCGASGRWENQ